jgi:hypothetical protein
MQKCLSPYQMPSYTIVIYNKIDDGVKGKCMEAGVIIC